MIVGCLSPWILIPTVAIFTLFYLMRVGYLETSRDLKRIESVSKYSSEMLVTVINNKYFLLLARSPIYTHLSASLHGLTTIRAFQAQKVLKNEFDNHQNSHSAAFFMFLAASRTFGFWLDLICVFYVALVVVFLLFINNGKTFNNNPRML